MKGKSVWILLILAATLMWASVAQAAEGKGKGTVSYVVVDSQTDKRADGGMVMRSHSKGVILADDPAAPIHLSTQDCYGTDLRGADGKQVVANGYCDAVDKDGDIWWIWWHDGADGNTWGFLGGTGKFEGIKGGGTTKVVREYPDGRLVITWDGTWQTK